MTPDVDRVKRKLYEIEERLEKFQKLLKKGDDGDGSITPHQQRQIAQSTTQVGKLLKQIDAVSLEFMRAFKSKLPDIVK